MPFEYRDLEEFIHELKDLDGIIGLLSWDEETYAPNGGRRARGKQTATLEAVRHRLLVDDELAGLIEHFRGSPELSPELRIGVERLARIRERAIRVPEALVKALAEARSNALVAWQDARATNKYAVFAPHLDEVVKLQRARAEALGSPSGDPYDALLDEHEPEMLAARIEPVFRELKEGLKRLVERILGSGHPPRRDFLEQRFAEDRQWQLTIRLLGDLGFDFNCGRQDTSAHPFTSAAAEEDARLTTHIYENNLLSAVFSTIHEFGHGAYEQGFDTKFHRTFLAVAPSMGIHESQSRLWENNVGRARAFWVHYLPVLKAAFPGQLDAVTSDELYRAVNFVEPSLIRTESDEVTYNLHIIVRFELERALLSGALPVADLPAAWAERMRAYLGVVPKTDSDGCLQDIHWAVGAIGYFPTYTIGNLYAAQLMAAYERANPQVYRNIEAGDFKPLLSWLRTHIHRPGHLKSAEETIRDTTGKGLEVSPFLNYLESKYGEIYRL